MDTVSLQDLTTFIVRAKAAIYIGSGGPSPSCRLNPNT